MKYKAHILRYKFQRRDVFANNYTFQSSAFYHAMSDHRALVLRWYGRTIVRHISKIVVL